MPEYLFIPVRSSLRDEPRYYLYCKERHLWGESVWLGSSHQLPPRSLLSYRGQDQIIVGIKILGIETNCCSSIVEKEFRIQNSGVRINEWEIQTHHSLKTTKSPI